MEVILLQKVANLGNIGDRVKVKSGYGRNYLLPQGKATLATAENVARFEARRAELERAAHDELARCAAARRSAQGRLQAHHHREGRHRRQAVRLGRHRRHRRGGHRGRPSLWRAAKCACRAARCARSASTSVHLHLHADVDLELPVIIVADEALTLTRRHEHAAAPTSRRRLSLPRALDAAALGRGRAVGAGRAADRRHGLGSDRRCRSAPRISTARITG